VALHKLSNYSLNSSLPRDLVAKEVYVFWLDWSEQWCYRHAEIHKRESTQFSASECHCTPKPGLITWNQMSRIIWCNIHEKNENNIHSQGLHKQTGLKRWISPVSRGSFRKTSQRDLLNSLKVHRYDPVQLVGFGGMNSSVAQRTALSRWPSWSQIRSQTNAILMPPTDVTWLVSDVT
jgi:hypothetical protein